MLNDESSEARARWVVVVPVDDGALFNYLTKSFAELPDVSVVLERRREPSSEAARAGRGHDRRAQARPVSNFGCAVIRRESAVAPQTPTTRSRTLLWPHLRIADVLAATEPGVRGGDVPPANGRKT